MRALASLFLFFGLLIILMSVHKQMSGFRGGGGEAIGGRTAGPSNLGDLEGFRLNEADLIYTKERESFRGGGGEAIGGHTAGPSNLGDLEGFRGGGGEAIGGHTAGPNNIGDLGSSADFFTSEQEQKKRDQVQEAFEGIGPASSGLGMQGPASEVTGRPETGSLDGPAPATLDTPRKPYNLLEQLPAAPRGSISCLKASCCSETDFEWRTNQTGNYLQRTNNYKREFPDSCSAPLTELNLAFYKNSVLQKV
jgi:hypothetical protein